MNKKRKPVIIKQINIHNEREREKKAKPYKKFDLSPRKKE